MHPEHTIATYFGMMWWDDESDGDKMYRQSSTIPR